MSFARNLIADLVAKRLWPVAVALVVALVAVPFALKGNSEPAVPAPLPGAATSATGSSPVVALADEGPRGGPSTTGRNPFEQKDVAPRASGEVTVTSTALANAAGAAAGSTGSSGGAPVDVPVSSLPGLSDVTPVGGTSVGSTGGTTGGTTPSGGTTKRDARDAYTVDIRFGQDGSLKSRSDVPRLSPLPSAANPFFVFLGVLADGETALFLVSSDAEATGDGKCLPSLDNCERVQLKAGQTEFFDVTTPEGESVQYQLDLVRVARERKANAAVAAAARVRESTDGRQFLRHAVDSGQVRISDLAYSPQMGLVVPSGRDQEQAGSVFGGYRVDLQFGEPGALVKRYNLARLTPLPSVESPSLLYMGVLADGETALFLNPSQAAASGDAACSPTPEQCERVTLKKGQTARFDVTTLDGATTQYQLDIDDIVPVQAATPAEAFASRMRESKAGRVVLRRLIHEVGALVSDLGFSPKSGTIVPADGQTDDAAPAPPTPGDKPRAAGLTADDVGTDE